MECPATYDLAWDGQSYFCQKPECDRDCPQVGKPILLSVGVKKSTEDDYLGVGPNALQYSRVLRSDRSEWLSNHAVIGVDLTAPKLPMNAKTIYSGCHKGIGLMSGAKQCYEYTLNGWRNDFVVGRGHGRKNRFGTANNLDPSSDINDRATRLLDGNGTTVGWSVYNANGDVTENFDLTGRLQTSTERNGQTRTYTYSDMNTPESIASSPGLLIRITNQFGRQLNFTYDASGRMSKMIDPAGGVYAYTYDEASSVVMPGSFPVGNMTSVTYPDGKKRTYWYNEQDKTANADLPAVLTGITDENGARHATITYNSNGKALSTELAGGVNKYVVNYPSLYGQSVVTDPLGSTQVYNFERVLGVVKLTGRQQGAGAGSSASTLSTTNDANGNISTQSDFNGAVTAYHYDLSRNLETKRVEASGTPEARTISTVWHPTFRIPVQIDEPLRRTIYTHDAKGNVLTKTEQGTTDANGSQGAAATVEGTPRVWSYTYNAVGQVLTAKGPRTDVNDVTSYSYDNQGNLASVTNPAGHVTTMSNYDAHGHVGTITDPNGVVTNLTYHVRGWLLSRAVTADGITETTSYNYDGVGQMTKVTMPDNSTVNYTYDDAHRLTKISDHLGNSINYTLDNMGNRINETTTDTTGALSRQITRVYDALNRLKEETGGTQ